MCDTSRPHANIKDLHTTVSNRGYVPHGDDEDYSRAAEHASRSAGGSGESDFFSSIIGNFVGKKSQLANEEVDEEGTQFHLQFHHDSPPIYNTRLIDRPFCESQS